MNLSALTADPDFSSPDGLWFSQNTGLCWIQTDGSTLDIDSYVGKKPSADTLRRFLVGPVDCELTGCTETPDGKTVFASIQRPGETLATATDVTDPSRT